jgi:hypothetical protein
LQSLVGEDIELGNRALSHASARNSRRGQLEDLSRCYRLLRFLRLTGVQFGEDMTEYKNIVKGSRRYDVKDTVVLDRVRTYMTNLLNSFENNTFQHYAIPHKFQKTSKRIRPKATAAEREATSILVLLSHNVEKESKCKQSMDLMEVPYLGAYDWLYFVEGSIKTLFKKNWDIPNLPKEGLEYVQAHAVHYRHPDLHKVIRAFPKPVPPRTGPRLFSSTGTKRKADEQKVPE